MKKQVYKVGDRVKILSSLCGDNHVGKIGKITKQMFYSKSGKVISREIKVGKETCSYATEIKLLPPLKPKKSIKKIKKKMFLYLRLSNGIRQLHYTRRELSEAELKRLPNWAWVSEQLADSRWSEQSWVKQYRLQVLANLTPNHQ